MDFQTLAVSTYEMSLSLLCGLFTLFISLKILHRILLNSPEGNLLVKGNTAVALFSGSMILAELLIVRQSILPAVEALRAMAGSTNRLTFEMFMISMGYFASFYLITLIVSLSCLYLSLLIYLKATVSLDELQEIKNGNLAVSILMSSVVLGIALFIQAPTERFIASLVSYEELGKVEVAPLTNEKNETKIFQLPLK